MFILDLCRELRKTQKELFNPVTGLGREDILEWMAYNRIKPFGYDEERRRFGMICAAVCNASGKSYEDHVDWTDFFRPSWEDPGEAQKKTSKLSFDSLLEVFKKVAVPKEKKSE